MKDFDEHPVVLVFYILKCAYFLRSLSFLAGFFLISVFPCSCPQNHLDGIVQNNLLVYYCQILRKLQQTHNNLA